MFFALRLYFSRKVLGASWRSQLAASEASDQALFARNSQTPYIPIQRDRRMLRRSRNLHILNKV